MMYGHTYSKSIDQPGEVANAARCQLNRKMKRSLSAFVPENLVSRDGSGSSVPRQPAHLHTQAESGAYFRDFSRVPRRRPFIYFDAAPGRCTDFFRSIPARPNTQDGSLELDSKYGCTQPDQSFTSTIYADACGVEYNIEGVAGGSVLAAVHIGEGILKPLEAFSL